ncbi:YbaK/EbsC family protein [Saxibacter everestensis]|uniref:YbaK/EbsC family protein n=1 Tax=Saxibacter everestensis TaxID=2909229 RepID=A0ABY8QY31_9MICO|nr:YbaK/EbsC family protein [Brevibacteriaceae bacterium ZFBP1038]
MTFPAFSGVDVLAAEDHPELLASAVSDGLQASGLITQAGVFAIDPEHADTETLTSQFGFSLDDSANCVVIGGKRGGEQRVAACVVLASTRADVNKTAKGMLDVRKASFLSTEQAVADTGMEFGGITPIGVPAVWRILVDSRVVDREAIILGSGVRRSKLVLPGSALAEYPGVEIVEGLANPA